MKRVLCIFLTMVLLCSCLSMTALAASPDNGENGYIVRLKEGSVRTFSQDGTYMHGAVLAQDETELSVLLDSGVVEYYEPNYTVQLFAANDIYYSRQWNLKSMKVASAWDAGLLGSGAVVAVIDTGINASHEDFRGVSVSQGYNTMTGGSDVIDTAGHGTMVAGIIAAKHDNGMGIAGISDQATIVPIKCFQNKETATVFDVCRGMYAAIDDYDSDVLCLSLGTEEDSSVLREAVSYAEDHGVIVVAAVGNEGNGALYYPAAYDTVVGVGAYGKNKQISSYSQYNDSVFISAPGDDIYSTFIGSSAAYATGSGTSFSAPHVAALAAIARSVLPELTPADFQALLMTTADDFGEPGYDIYYGYGGIDTEAFVAALSELAGLTDEEGFTDIAGHWAETDIKHCVELGLFSGVAPLTFDPNGIMTRAMLVTVLYRMSGAIWEGEPTVSFGDVADASAWYYPAVCWAAANGIVTGDDAGLFRPLDPVSREQIAAIVYRYAGSPEITDIGLLDVFPDSGEISAWAHSGMAWCYKNAIIGGTDPGILIPTGTATRAQVAAILSRFINNIPQP